MAGKFFEEWVVGEMISHEIRRTVTETDNLLFSTMTHNPQPLHIDAEAAKKSEFGQILVNGTFTFSLDGRPVGGRHHAGHAGGEPWL
jgi:acyl dehydratase